MVINFAYASLADTGDRRWTIFPSSPAATATGYIFHYFIPSLALANPDRYRIVSVEEALAAGTPFIYPLELVWKFAEWMVTGWGGSFLEQAVPEAVLDAARRGRAIILLSIAHEGRLLTVRKSHRDPVVNSYDLIDQFVRDHALPPGSFWFLQGNLGGETEYAAWRTARGIAPHSAVPFEVRCVELVSYVTQSLWRLHQRGLDLRVDWDWGEHVLGKSNIATRLAVEPLDRPLDALYASVADPSGETVPDKLFLCMNRIPRPHRRLLVCWLEMKGLLDRSLVSFRDDAPAATVYPLTELQAAWERVQAKLPLEIDSERIERFDASYHEYWKRVGFDFASFKSASSWPYRRSLLNVVTESLFESTEYDATVRTLTEKTLKPILNAQPFVVLGKPGILAYLHRIGFRTFAPHVDESYDSIEDDMERLNSILGTLARIGGMSGAELSAMHLALRANAEYNAELLKTMTTPMEAVLNDMTTRLHAATRSRAPDGFAAAGGEARRPRMALA